MVNFESVFSDAKQLSADDRLRLIDELWTTVPDNSALPLHEDWKGELERRVARIKSGEAKTTPWETIRDAALKSLTNGEAT